MLFKANGLNTLPGFLLQRWLFSLTDIRAEVLRCPLSPTASTPYHIPKSEGTILCSVCLQHCHLLGNLSFSLGACATNHSGAAALLWAGMSISTHGAASPQFSTCSHRGLRGSIGYGVFTQQTGLNYKDWKKQTLHELPYAEVGSFFLVAICKCNWCVQKIKKKYIKFASKII